MDERRKGIARGDVTPCCRAKLVIAAASRVGTRRARAKSLDVRLNRRPRSKSAGTGTRIDRMANQDGWGSLHSPVSRERGSML